MDAVKDMVTDMGRGYGVARTGIRARERQSDRQASVLCAISALVMALSV
ncbi:hypothetical protein ATI53_104120 [Salipiger aestuarii]|uniref:Uncharacterized protein n=1 Tax=Salipiger aestuarii TaxID=568098 RepID=A0A327XV06_9RHOB|nr:hypothetical protein [Salipiger aestuarii]RAK12788.1 hypothetical protein ATI53_104120 [Salipiger aestuarii]